MQFPGKAKPSIGVVFDCAMGSRIDDALALAMLHGFEGKEKARIAAIGLCTSDLKAAQFCDVVGLFYASATTGVARVFMHLTPIGLDAGKPSARPSGSSPMLDVPLARTGTDGKPVYSTTVRSLNDTADVSTLIRNALTAQEDQNAVVVLTGPATDLAKLLDMYGLPDLISQKVKLLCMAAGAFPDGPPEPNIKADIAAARRVLAGWSVPIVAVGYEIGAELPFPGESIAKDFAWSTAHPVVDAYRAYRPMPYDAPSWAMAAMLYAVRPKENYFKLSEPGTIIVSDDGRTSFAASDNGRHRYLILDPAQKERIIQTYTEIASAKPVERKLRKPPEEKKDEKKEDTKEEKKPEPAN
jgi:inosine-uridine nucleoside N-ribohydrolase